MDISDIVTEEYVEFDIGTPVSKLRGAFDDPGLKAVLVTDGNDLVGVVTRRQLASSREQPQQKAKSVVWHVPTVEPFEDIREVARLMVGSGAKLLPVMAGEDLRGVVTADDLLAKVKPYLNVVTVADVYTQELVTVEPSATVGDALHHLREDRITHLPVVGETGLSGILSLFDLVGFTTRELERSQGGDAGGTDSFGGGISDSAGSTRGGGFGAREGEIARLLDLPVRDVMSEPVGTVRPTQPLDEAVEEMFDLEASSLVVVDEDDDPAGIVTKTDVLEALTWTAEGKRPVQVFGIDLLDDMTYDGVRELVDDLARKYQDMTVLEAKIHLHEHDETLRGTPLILARIRLFTDKGYFVASEEGYGASHALRLAANDLERQVLKGKTYGQSKKRLDDEVREKLFGWWLTG